MANIIDYLINAAKKTAQNTGNQIITQLKSNATKPVVKPLVPTPPLVSPYTSKTLKPAANSWTISDLFKPQKVETNISNATIGKKGDNYVPFTTIGKAPVVPLAFRSQSNEERNNIALQARQQEEWQRIQDEQDKGFFGALKQSIPNAPVYQAPIKAAQAITEPFRTATTKLGKDINQIAPELDSSAKARTAVNLASTIYEGGKLYYGSGLGGTASKLANTATSLSKPGIVSGLASALPENMQGYVRPVLETASVLKSPQKLVGALNVFAGRATDPASNAINSSDWSQPAKDAANLVLNIFENAVAVKGGKYISGKAAPSVAGIKAGYDAYQKGQPLEGVLDSALAAKDAAMPKKVIASDIPQMSKVLGANSGELQEAKIKTPVTKNIVDQEFNTEKLNVSPAEAARIDSLREGLGISKREVRSFEDMRKLAAAYETETDALLKRDKKISDAEVIALRNLVSQNSDFLAKNENKVFPSEQENAIHQQKVNAAQVQINQALKKLVKGGTEAGRTVVAFKQLANKSMDPTFWYLQAQKILGEKNLTPEMQSQINKLTSDNDRIGVAMYVANLRQPSLAEKLTTTWKAGLLTSPTTHIANITGNAVMGATNLVSKGISTGLDQLASLVTGKRTTTVSPLAALKGAGKGVGEAIKFMKTGIDADQTLNKYDLPKGSVFKGDSIPSKLLKGYTETVFRSLGAEDKIFRTSSALESLASQAKVTALNEGLDGKAFKNRVEELTNKPTEEMALQAIADAEYATFNNKNVLSDMFSSMKARGYASDKVGGKLAATALDITTPFIKTPTNVAARLVDFSPLGLIKTLAGQVDPKTRGQKRLVDDLGRTITGSGILALGISLANGGLMTGAIPESDKDREQFYAEGKQPNSINVGGKWYQLNRIAPIGNLLAIGAQIADLSKEKSGVDLVASSVASGVKNITDQTFLQGLSGGLQVLTDPEANAEKFLSQTASSIVPTIVARLAKATDPIMRNPKGILQSFAVKVPGLSQTVPARLDVFGNDVQQATGLQALVDPFNTKVANNDPVLKEARKVGISLGLPSNRMFNDTLTPEEYNEYQKVQGGILRDVLEEITSGEEYKNLSGVEKYELFDKTVKGVQTKVKSVVYPAAIINRYQLTADSNPEVLTEVMNTLNKEELFSSLPAEEQKGIIEDILQATSESSLSGK